MSDHKDKGYHSRSEMRRVEHMKTSDDIDWQYEFEQCSERYRGLKEDFDHKCDQLKAENERLNNRKWTDEQAQEFYEDAVRFKAENERLKKERDKAVETLKRFPHSLTAIKTLKELGESK